jgi:hypothetical protein
MKKVILAITLAMLTVGPLAACTDGSVSFQHDALLPNGMEPNGLPLNSPTYG